jgi:hypothetical protein
MELAYKNEAKARDDSNKRSLNELYERMSNRISELEIAIEDYRQSNNNLLASFKSHVNENSFPDEFTSDIVSAHNAVVLGNESLPTSFKSIMSKWAALISEFGLQYSKSNERKKKGIKFKIYLNGKKKELIEALNDFIDTRKIPNKDLNGNKKKFSDYLKANDIHHSTDNLFEKLYVNGLDTEQFKKLFSEYLIEFDTAFLRAAADFRDQKDYSLMNYERKLLGDD